MVEKIENLNEKIENLNEKIENLNGKLDQILLILNKDISKNTKKMGEHIEFVENVYENVKSPLGFICNTIKHYIGTKKYTLDNNIEFKKLK
jgi:predicted RNase H-like nuclease (RuvC/YqgF family)